MSLATVSGQGIRPDNDKIEAVANTSRLKCASEVLCSLGSEIIVPDMKLQLHDDETSKHVKLISRQRDDAGDTRGFPQLREPLLPVLLVVEGQLEGPG